MAILLCRRQQQMKSLQATLQHVVATYDPINGRAIYVQRQSRDADRPGSGRHAD